MEPAAEDEEEEVGLALTADSILESGREGDAELGGAGGWFETLGAALLLCQAEGLGGAAIFCFGGGCWWWLWVGWRRVRDGEMDEEEGRRQGEGNEIEEKGTHILRCSSYAPRSGYSTTVSPGLTGIGSIPVRTPPRMCRHHRR